MTFDELSPEPKGLVEHRAARIRIEPRRAHHDDLDPTNTLELMEAALMEGRTAASLRLAFQNGHERVVEDEEGEGV